MAKAQDEHERHAAQHLVAAAGTAACAVNRRLHGLSRASVTRMKS